MLRRTRPLFVASICLLTASRALAQDPPPTVDRGDASRPPATPTQPSDPFMEPLMPKNAYCVYADNGTLVWAAWFTNPEDKTRAPRRWYRFWRQRPVDARPQFAFEVCCTTGRVDIKDVATDRSTLLTLGLTEYQWVPHNVRALTTEDCKRLRLDGDECVILDASEGGWVVRPQRPSGPAPIYFVPMWERVAVTTPKLELVPAEHAGKDYDEPAVFRGGDMLLCANHILDFRDGTVHKFPHELRHVVAFDGETIVGQAQGNITAFSLDGEQLVSDEEAQKLNFWAMAAVRDRVGFLLRAENQQSASRVLLVEAIDLDPAAASSRVLSSQRIPLGDDENWNSNRSFRRPFLVSDDGLHLWARDRWHHIPWAERPSSDDHASSAERDE